MKKLAALTAFVVLAIGITAACGTDDDQAVSEESGDNLAQAAVAAAVEPGAADAGAAERFTPDGVSFIPVTSLRREGPAARLLPSYIATSGYSPDGVSDLSNRAPARRFTSSSISSILRIASSKDFASIVATVTM